MLRTNPMGAERGYSYPGDFRALSREESSIPASHMPVSRPTFQRQKSTSTRILLVLKHSFVVFMFLVAAGFVIGFLLVGTLLSSSDANFYVALGVVYTSEVALLIWGGYRISSEAMEKGNGWIYGASCVAAVVFLWQPLVSFLLKMIGSERVLVPQTFTPLGILAALFLFLPLGALGGWLAEKRYMR